MPACRWVIQGDIFGELTDSNHCNSDSYGLGRAVHIAMRFDIHLLGIFGGYLHSHQDTHDNSETSEQVFAGMEAQRYFDHTIIYGQIGWIDGNWDSDDDGYDSLSCAVFRKSSSTAGFVSQRGEFSGRNECETS